MCSLLATIPGPVSDASGTLDVLFVGLLAALGILLWLAGRTLFQPTLLLGGLVGGVLGGWTLVVATDLQASPWIGAAVGGLVGLVLVSIFTRFVILAGTTAVLGLSAPLAMWLLAVSGLLGPGAVPPPLQDDAPTPSVLTVGRDAPASEDDLDAWVQSLPGSAAPPAVAPPEAETPPEPRGGDGVVDRVQRSIWRMQVDRFVGQMERKLNLADGSMASRLDSMESQGSAWLAYGLDAWAALPHQLRLMLIISAAIGAAMGVLCASLAPGMATAIFTSWGGAWLTLSSLESLLLQMGVAAGVTDQLAGPVSWSTAWLVAALAGTVLQCRGRRSRSRRVVSGEDG